MKRLDQLESMAVGFVVCDDTLDSLEQITEDADLWCNFEGSPDEAVNHAEAIFDHLKLAYYYGMLDAFRLAHPSVKFSPVDDMSNEEIVSLAGEFPFLFTRNPLSLSLRELSNVSVLVGETYNEVEISKVSKAFWGLVSTAIWKIVKDREQGVSIQ